MVILNKKHTLLLLLSSGLLTPQLVTGQNYADEATCLSETRSNCISSLPKVITDIKTLPTSDVSSMDEVQEYVFMGMNLLQSCYYCIDDSQIGQICDALNNSLNAVAERFGQDKDVVISNIHACSSKKRRTATQDIVMKNMEPADHALYKPFYALVDTPHEFNSLSFNLFYGYKLNVGVAFAGNFRIETSMLDFRPRVSWTSSIRLPGFDTSWRELGKIWLDYEGQRKSLPGVIFEGIKGMFPVTVYPVLVLKELTPTDARAEICMEMKVEVYIYGLGSKSQQKSLGCFGEFSVASVRRYMQGSCPWNQQALSICSKSFFCNKCPKGTKCVTASDAKKTFDQIFPEAKKRVPYFDWSPMSLETGMCLPTVPKELMNAEFVRTTVKPLKTTLENKKTELVKFAESVRKGIKDDVHAKVLAEIFGTGFELLRDGYCAVSNMAKRKGSFLEQYPYFSSKVPTFYAAISAETQYGYKGAAEGGLFLQTSGLPDKIEGGLFFCGALGYGAGFQAGVNLNVGLQFSHPHNLGGSSVTFDVDIGYNAGFGVSVGKTFTNAQDLFDFVNQNYHIDIGVGGGFSLSGAVMGNYCVTTKTVNVQEYIEIAKTFDCPYAEVDFSDPLSRIKYELHGGATVQQAPGLAQGVKALRISRSGEYAKLPFIDISPSKMKDCTIIVSLYLNQLEAGEGWVVSHDNGSYERSIILDDGRFSNMGLGVGSAGKVYNGSDNKPPVRKWFHVVAVFRQGGDCEFWMDGVKAPLTPQGNNKAGHGALYIGSSVYDNYHIDGWIKEVQVYDRAFTTQDVEDFHKEFKADIFGQV